jgi:hypothetical protein
MTRMREGSKCKWWGSRKDEIPLDELDGPDGLDGYIKHGAMSDSWAIPEVLDAPIKHLLAWRYQTISPWIYGRIHELRCDDNDPFYHAWQIPAVTTFLDVQWCPPVL